MKDVPDLFEVVEIELTDQGLEAGVTEIFRKNLAFQAGGVLDMEGEAVWGMPEGRREGRWEREWGG